MLDDEHSNDTKEIESRFNSLQNRESEMNKALDKVAEMDKKPDTLRIEKTENEKKD